MNEKEFQKTFVENVISQNINDEELLKLIVPIGNISPQKVIQVYAEDYQYRMLEAMQSNFESLWMILGDDLFKETVFDYIVKQPSDDFDLNQIGKSFPVFLQTYKNIINEIPFIVELAQFELTYWNIFHAPLIKTAIPQIKNSEEILNAFFNFDKNICLFSTNFKLFDIFKNRKLKSDVFFTENSLDNFSQKSYYLLYKTSLQVSCFQLSEAQFDFFEKLKDNKSIRDVFNLELNISPEEAQELFKFISSSLLSFLNVKIEKA